MQNKTQQRISGLINAYKHKRRWKILTIILSVIVLCNTFYAMQNAAVAVTEENGDVSQIGQLLSSDDSSPVGSGNEQDIITIIAQDENDTDPAETPAEGGDTSDPADGGLTAGGEDSDPAAGTDDPYAEDLDPDLGGGLTEGKLEGELTLEDLDDLEDEDVLGETREARPLAAPLRAPQKIESAYPTLFRVLDEDGTYYATRVTQGDAVSVQIGWDISDISEVTTPGDYVEIILPDGLDFSAITSGYFKLNETTRLVDGTVYTAGTNIARYELDGNVLTVTYLKPCIDLIQSNLLLPAFTLKGQPWAVLPIGQVIVTAPEGEYKPAITINGDRKYNDRTITVLGAAIDQITNVQIKSYKINNYENGIVSNSYYSRSYVEVGSEDVVKLQIEWSWTASRGVTNGDFFEIKLPDTLSYTPYGPRASIDTRGNVITDEIYYDDVRGAYYFRNTYESLTSYGFTTSDGFTIINGYVKDADKLSYDASGKVTITASVSVDGGTASKTGYITVIKKASSTELRPGEWRLRAGTYGNNIGRVTYDLDGGSYVQAYGYHYDYYSKKWEQKWGSVSAYLFVISAHNETLVREEPFRDVETVEFVPGKANYQTSGFDLGGSNYLVTYCANAGAPAPNDNGKDWSVYQMLPIEDVSFLTQKQKDSLRRVLANAFPYITLDEMYERLNLKEWEDNQWVIKNSNYRIDSAELLESFNNYAESWAANAVNYAIWTITSPNNIRINTNLSYDEDFIIRDLSRRLLEAPMPTGGGNAYRIDGTPTLSVDATGVAKVSGRIIPASGASSLNGTFTGGGKSASVNIKEDGTFTAELSGVKKTDEFSLHFSGTAASYVNVWYFEVSHSYYTSPKEQDLIAAEVGEGSFSFDYTFTPEGETNRKVRVLKRWVNEQGVELTTLPTAPVTVKLYRRVQGGVKEFVQDIELKAPTYSWEGELPIVNADGKVYDYWIEEPNSPSGYTLVGIETSAEDNGQTLVLTATNKEETTRIKVIKKWEDIDGEAMTGFAARVQLYAVIGGREVPVYTDKDPVTGARKEGGIRVLRDCNYFFAPGAGRYEAIVFLNSKEDEGPAYIFEDLPKNDTNGAEIQYVIKEITAGPQGQAYSWPIEKDANGDGYWTGIFHVISDPANGAPDMNADMPTVTITNKKEPTEVVVIKDWPGITDEVAKGRVVTVELYKINEDGRTVTYIDRAELRASADASEHFRTTFELLDKYEVNKEGRRVEIQYVVREVKVTDNGVDITDMFRLEDQSLTYGQNNELWQDAEGKTYARVAQDDGIATVRINNRVSDTTITVVKEWKNLDGTTWTEAVPDAIRVTLSYEKEGVSQDWLAANIHIDPLTVTLTKEDDWSHTWTNVPVVDGLKFYIEEVAIGVKDQTTGDLVWTPADEAVGFTAEDQKVEVVWDKTLSDGKGGFKVANLVNIREDREIILIKESDFDGSKLQGAEFALYVYDGNEFVPFPEPGKNAFTTNADGEIRITGLLYGKTYKLVETLVPAGFREPGEGTGSYYVTFTLSDNGTPADRSDDKIVITDQYMQGTWNEDELLFSDASTTGSTPQLQIRAVNRIKTYELPEAGGLGTKAYTTGGMSLMIATLLMYSTWKFMRKNEKGGRKNHKSA